MARTSLFIVSDGEIWQSESGNGDAFAIASWIYQDVQSDTTLLIEIIDYAVGMNGLSDADPQEFTGNAWSATMESQGIWLENLYSAHIEPRLISYNLLVEVIAQYWRCLLEIGLSERLTIDVQKFEEWCGRRARIPWPLDSPEDFAL
ncbi:hypothetical protein [Nocardia sp. CC227C]|uniref:hypothetical protein n=1 Tax=Nocardia sp. CC227C TaxID=3044562 RepID=UPI00278BBF99|nr:hypothetical protein [Nocardia sp. CC227C]